MVNFVTALSCSILLASRGKVFCEGKVDKSPCPTSFDAPQKKQDHGTLAEERTLFNDVYSFHVENGKTRFGWEIGKPQPAVVQRLELFKGRILDVGCGWGSHSLFLARSGRTGIVGVDVVESAVQHARKEALRLGLSKHVRFEVGDATGLPSLFRGSGETFDTILASALFHTIPLSAHRKLAKSLARVLRTGGALYMLDMSEKETRPTILGDPPWRFATKQALCEAFREKEGWKIKFVEDARFHALTMREGPEPNTDLEHKGGSKAYFTKAVRMQSVPEEATVASSEPWRPYKAPSGSGAPRFFGKIECNIDRLDEATWNRSFAKDYYLQRPVILQGWQHSEALLLQERLQRGPLLNDFGDEEVKVGKKSFQLQVDGMAAKAIPLSKYVEDMPSSLYLFDRGEFFAATKLHQNWSHAPVFDTLDTYRDVRLTLALGGAGNGLTWHRHKDSYTMQLHGRKRWGIYGPGQFTPTGYLASEDYPDWLQLRRKNEKFKPPTWECVQETGEVLYVPEGFFHATVSLGDAVAVVQQSTTHLPSTAYGMSNDAAKMVDEKLMAKAAALDKTNPEIRILQGNMYEQMKQFDKAIKAYRKAVKLNPLDPRPRVLLILLYNRLERFQDTNALAKSVEKIDEQIGGKLMASIREYKKYYETGGVEDPGPHQSEL